MGAYMYTAMHPDSCVYMYIYIYIYTYTYELQINASIKLGTCKRDGTICPPMYTLVCIPTHTCI